MANMTNLTHLTMEIQADGSKLFYARYEKDVVYQVDIAHPTYTVSSSMIDGKIATSTMKAIRTATRTKSHVEKLEISAQEAEEIMSLIQIHDIPHRIMNDGQVIEIMESINNHVV